MKIESPLPHNLRFREWSVQSYNFMWTNFSVFWILQKPIQLCSVHKTSKQHHVCSRCVTFCHRMLLLCLRCTALWYWYYRCTQRIAPKCLWHYVCTRIPLEYIAPRVLVCWQCSRCSAAPECPWHWRRSLVWFYLWRGHARPPSNLSYTLFVSFYPCLCTSLAFQPYF